MTAAGGLPVVEFGCGCSAAPGDAGIELRECSESCPNGAFMVLELDRCLRQLRVAALVRNTPAPASGEGSGGSV